MEIIQSLNQLRSWRQTLPATSTVGFVPTMGALHAGHLSLVTQSRSQCTHTVVSIFVNPLQFAVNEDLSRYPRPFERDCELLQAANIDVLYAPTPETLYASDHSTYIVEESLSPVLCGAFRPGHYRGVATVVLKLFNRVQPHVAFFGQKDAQQCAVIERMVRDLDLSVQIVRGETLRESDGLAMSSRNQYLSSEERAMAPHLYRVLQSIATEIRGDETEVRKLLEHGLALLAQQNAFKLQYLEIVDPGSLAPLTEVRKRQPALIAVAAYLGTTRLIDNVLI